MALARQSVLECERPVMDESCMQALVIYRKRFPPEHGVMALSRLRICWNDRSGLLITAIEVLAQKKDCHDR